MKRKPLSRGAWWRIARPGRRRHLRGNHAKPILGLWCQGGTAPTPPLPCDCTRSRIRICQYSNLRWDLVVIESWLSNLLRLPRHYNFRIEDGFSHHLPEFLTWLNCQRTDSVALCRTSRGRKARYTSSKLHGMISRENWVERASNL